MTHIDIYGNFDPLMRPKRRRRQTKPKDSVPTMTTGLETKLNKALKCNADDVVRYLTNKLGEPKKSVYNGYISMIFGNHSSSYYQTYRKVEAFPVISQWPITVDELTVPIQTRTICFQIRLSIRELDNTLESYNFQMSAS